MLTIPFLILSYGSFNANKKLFSYMLNDIHTLPIFINPVCARDFVETFSQLEGGVALQAQICSDAKMALSMFESITAMCPDLMRIVIDPSPPIRDDRALTDIANLSLFEQFRDIDEVLEQLRGM